MIKDINVCDFFTSKEFRKKYVEKFVDTNQPYYINLIEKMKLFSDGFCYEGYLWDCLKSPLLLSEEEAEQILKRKNKIYIMWDIHSCEKILVPNYWKYPKERIVFAEKWDDEIKSVLPEDIYLFDESFQWTIAFTHEEVEDGYRYCLLVD